MHAPLSVPIAGRTIQKALAPWANPVYDCFLNLKSGTPTEIQAEVVSVFRSNYARPRMPISVEFQSANDFDLACGAAMSVLLLARAAFRAPSLTLSEAEKWFFGDASLHNVTFAELNWPSDKALQPLAQLSYDSELDELLPYVMEVFEVGPTGGSRTADASRRNDRQRKRQLGTFYTPSDVVDFIVGETVRSWLRLVQHSPKRTPTVLDPACGTGIFLLCAFDKLVDWFGVSGSVADRVALCTTSLFGIDVSEHAVQGSSFAMLARCISRANDRQNGSLSAFWGRILGNHVVLDATQLLKLRTTEVSGTPLELGVENPALERLSLAATFPALADGADILVGNPPYSTANGLPSATDGTRGTAYLPFVRMMWELTRNDESTSGVVVPLSLGYHSGGPFRSVRRDMAKVPGIWTVSFFDRTPDSLFGDDVKTRNCIALLSRDNDCVASLRTSSFVRWNSRQRSSLFSTLTHTTSDWRLATSVIPKLGNDLEVESYRAIRSDKHDVLSAFAGSSPITVGHEQSATSRILVGPTAYNWISAFRFHPYKLLDDFAPQKLSSICTKVYCADDQDADAVFALCSSRLAYWLWRVEGDGFHVGRGFIFSLPTPFKEMSRSQHTELGELGRKIWGEMQRNPVFSVNKGVRSISFSPRESHATLSLIDEFLASVLHLPEEFPPFLVDFVQRTVVAGRSAEPDETDELMPNHKQQSGAHARDL